MVSKVKLDIVNKKFTLLTALEPSTRKGKSNIVYWICKCDCGSVVDVRRDALLNGLTKSCGCLPTGKVTHGHWSHNKSSPTWNSWQAMKQRCLNPHNIGYHNYGGRGIIVCNEWVESFEIFFKDMGERPKGHTLDRIDTNGNYEPKNCRWATYKVQRQNQRILWSQKSGG